MKSFKVISAIAIILLHSSCTKCDFYPKNRTLEVDNNNYHFKYIKIESHKQEIAMVKRRSEAKISNSYNFSTPDSEIFDYYFYDGRWRNDILQDSMAYVLIAEVVNNTGSDMHRYLITLPSGWRKMDKIRGLEVRAL
jgi:hypothetical protein